MKSYRGENAAYHFVESLVELEKEICKIMYKNVKMIITDEQEIEFQQAVDCHICKKALENDRVRDHCHITGLYRGPAHNKCNIFYDYKNTLIPVFFHNLKGYDSHLIIQEMGKFDKEISCIPQSSEQFLSFRIGKLVFKDSYAFLHESLDNLTKTLTKKKFSLTKKCNPDLNDDRFDLLHHKNSSIPN